MRTFWILLTVALTGMGMQGAFFTKNGGRAS